MTLKKHIEFIGQPSFTFAAAESYIESLINLDSLFESLCDQGEEIHVGKATIDVSVTCNGGTSGMAYQLVLVVSDDACASANGPAGATDLDSIVHALTAGDFEFKILGPATHVRHRFGEGNSAAIVAVASSRVDITAPLRKVAQRLIYSPVFSGLTNPHVHLAMACVGSNGLVVAGHALLELDYTVKVKPARMI
jgi:hypothetical protein